MAARHPTDLVQRGRVYYFRRAVPCELRQHMGRQEIKFSLKTSDFSIAKLRCLQFSNRFERMMETVKAMPPLGKDKIEQLLRSYFSDLLSKSEEIAYLLPDDDMVDIDDEAASIQGGMDNIRKQISSHNYDDAALVDADELLAPLSNSGTKIDDEDFDAICHGILRARLENSRILAAMLKSDFQNTEPLDPMFRGIKSPGMPPLPGDETSSSAMTVSLATTKFL